MWGKDQCLKKNAQLKLTEDFSLGYSVSDSSEGQFQRGKGRARIYSSFSEKQTKTTMLWNIKSLLLIIKTDISC